ncbi:MAG: hypothetical protein ACP5OU_05805 [Methanothrix sp.]
MTSHFIFGVNLNYLNRLILSASAYHGTGLADLGAILGFVIKLDLCSLFEGPQLWPERMRDCINVERLLLRDIEAASQAFEYFRIELYGIRYLAAITAALALEVHLDPNA